MTTLSRPGLHAGRSLAVRHWDWAALACGLLTGVPVIVGVIRALGHGWTPVLDDAVIAANAYDVFSSHFPLLGLYSDSSVGGIGVLHDLGPMVLWVEAVPAHFLGPWGLVVEAGAINVASILGAIVLAYRRGGRGFMVATALALIVVTRSLPPETWHDPLNPSCALLPLALLMFLAWSIACGELQLLPVAVLVASFVVQAHFTLVPVGVGLMVVAVGGLIARSRRTLAPPGKAARNWVVGAGVVAVALWWPPVLDQIIHRPGNLRLVVQTATSNQPTLGLTRGWHALERAIGVWPWWLRHPQDQAHRLYDVILTPSWLSAASTVIVLLMLVAVGVIGSRRQRWDVAVAAVLSLVLSAAIAVSVAATPNRLSLAVEKAVRWTAPGGMFIWLLVGWAALTLWSPRWSKGPVQSRRTTVTAALGLVATALAALLVSLGQSSDTLSWMYQPARRLEAQVTSHLSRDRPIVVDSSTRFGDLTAFAFETALIYDLRRTGYHVYTPQGLELQNKLGLYYRPPPGPNVHLLLRDDRVTTAPGRLLAHASLAAAPASVEPGISVPQRAVTVSTVR